MEGNENGQAYTVRAPPSRYSHMANPNRSSDPIREQRSFGATPVARLLPMMVVTSVQYVRSTCNPGPSTDQPSQAVRASSPGSRLEFALVHRDFVRSAWRHSERQMFVRRRQRTLGNLTMVATSGLLGLTRVIDVVVDEQVPGAFVETGCWRGGASFLAAQRFVSRGDPAEIPDQCGVRFVRGPS